MPSYTSILELTGSDWQDLNRPYYLERFAEDARTDDNLSKIDTFVGYSTASFKSSFELFHSGCNASQNLANAILPGFIGAEFSPIDRVITEVVAWAAKSGSGGVTRLDVQIQQGAAQPANFSSIFSDNAYKPALSSSLGDFFRVSAKTFVSGANMVWAASSSLKVIQDTAAGDATAPNGQYGIHVDVYWKPSGSYGV